MVQVNIFEAKTDLSKLIRLLEQKKEDLIIVARNGKPIVKMTLINETPVLNRIGIAKGKLNITGDFDADNAEIADMLSQAKTENMSFMTHDELIGDYNEKCIVLV